MNQAIAILSTCPDQASAQSIASHLVENRLAACVNIINNVVSVYQWEGKTEQSQEVCLLIKTLAHQYQFVEKAILELHPYELPEIISVTINTGSNSYLNWIEQNVNSKTAEV